MTVLLSGLQQPVSTTYSSTNRFGDFIAILLIFVVVLAATALTTKWIANYQKQQGLNGNIEVIESSHLANNKYIQIVRVGERYIVLAVCKDTVTMLCELSAEELKLDATTRKPDFKKMLEMTLKKDTQDLNEPKE